MKTAFGEYLDKKHREARKQLGILKEVLAKGGMRVSDNREPEGGGDPYLYLHNPNSNASFKGVRIYKVGDRMAFRIQREEKTYPYGKAYGLDLQKLFTDLLSDDMKESTAGKLVIDAIIKEMNRFFTDSQKAEKELQAQDIQGTGDPLGQVLLQTSPSDYANSIPGNP